MKKISVFFLTLVLILTNTIDANATSKSSGVDGFKLLTSENDIDTYEISEFSQKYIFTVDPTNKVVIIDQNVYSFDTFFKALQAQSNSHKKQSLDVVISSFESISPTEVMSILSNKSSSNISILATNPPTSGYNSYGGYTYIYYVNFGFSLAQAAIAALVSTFNMTPIQAQNYTKTVLNAGINAGLITAITQTLFSNTYKKIRQAFHPTVMYAVKQESENCTLVGTTYFMSGIKIVTYFWSQQPY